MRYTGIDHDPFGMLLVGRTWDVNYRYGFNGKEQEDEILGNKNSLDFGARIYNSRLGKWLSCDKFFYKYPAISPYHFGYNSPIICIDRDGNEDVIVIGGKDGGGGDAYKFINCGLKKMNDLEGSSSLTVVMFVTPDLTYEDRLEFETYAKIGGATVVYVSTAEQLTNYLNSKDKTNNCVTENRENDLVTSVTFFGHGYADRENTPENKSDPGAGPTFEPGHGQSTITLAQDLQMSWGIDDVKKLSPDAFDCSVVWDFQSCNAASTNTQGLNLASAAAEQTGGKASGWDGRSDYLYIYNGEPLFFRLLDKLRSVPNMRPSQNYPTAGCHNDGYYDSNNNGTVENNGNDDCFVPSDRETYDYNGCSDN